MGAVEQAASEETIVGINVTPLVDITLVLLIVFMVTAKLIVSEAIPFDLPKAATGGAVQVVFTVSLDASGQVRVDGKEMQGDESLRRAAHEALARDAEIRTVVQASSVVPHGTVVHVLDQLRQAGIRRIAFGVDKTPLEPAR
ncbi:MAG TPA: biopolymer transporter ExbD [Polyangiaceae bacterium]|jgi:biopolymer transport protein ExbD|nr:biopolymer transporter ExbD [Polyangiaceae bacterium]